MGRALLNEEETGKNQCRAGQGGHSVPIMQELGVRILIVL